MTPNAGPLSLGAAIRLALSCRCPVCGQGKLYAGYLKVVERCAVCGTPLAAHDAGDGPAVFVIFLLGFTVVPLALLVELRWEPPLWLHLLLWPALTVALTLALLPPAKAYIVGLNWRQYGRGEPPS